MIILTRQEKRGEAGPRTHTDTHSRAERRSMDVSCPKLGCFDSRDQHFFLCSRFSISKKWDTSTVCSCSYDCSLYPTPEVHSWRSLYHGFHPSHSPSSFQPSGSILSARYHCIWNATSLILISALGCCAPVSVKTLYPCWRSFSPWRSSTWIYWALLRLCYLHLE